MRVNQWEGVETTVKIKPTPQMLIDLELDDRIKELEIDFTHSGYDDPGWCAADPDDSRAPEFDVGVDDILHVVAHYKDGNIEDLSSDIHAKILDDSSICELMLDEIF